MKRAIVLALFAALAAAHVALGGRTATPTLHGTVGPGFTISLTRNRAHVKTLPAGSYKLVVADKASIHNFVVEKSKGGTFEKEVTAVGFTGTKTITLKLSAGTYEYYCRPHESTMHGDFTVK